MFLLDVNVVVAAARDDHPSHATVRPWLEGLREREEPFCVPDIVWASFLRLVTNRRIFPIPMPRAAAWAFVDAVRAQPQHLTLGPGPRHLALLKAVCEEADASGDLVPDAVLAAVAAEHGCTVATLDRDFARFESVRHVRLPAR